MRLTDLAKMPGYNPKDLQLFLNSGLSREYYAKYLNRTKIPVRGLSLERYIRLFYKLILLDEALTLGNAESKRGFIQSTRPARSQNQTYPLQEPCELGSV